MALTFNSKTIKKVVSFDDLEKLSNPELDLLEEELATAIKTMNESMASITHEKYLQGQEVNSDWLVKIKRKEQICKTFLEKIQTNIALNKSEFVRQKYQQNLNKLLQEILGKEQYEELKSKAKNLAFDEVVKHE